MVTFFSREIYLGLAYILTVTGFIIFFIWYSSRIIRTYNEDCRVYEPKLFMYSFSMLYLFLLLSTWMSAYESRILSSVQTISLLAALLLVIPGYIDKKSRNTDYDKTKKWNKFFVFAENRQFVFVFFFFSPE